MATKEIKNWEWIKSVEVQYNRYGNAHTRNYFLLIDREIQTRN